MGRPTGTIDSEKGKSKGAEFKGAGTTGAQSDQLAAAAACAARWQHVAAVTRAGREADRQSGANWLDEVTERLTRARIEETEQLSKCSHEATVVSSEDERPEQDTVLEVPAQQQALGEAESKLEQKRDAEAKERVEHRRRS